MKPRKSLHPVTPIGALSGVDTGCSAFDYEKLSFCDFPPPVLLLYRQEHRIIPPFLLVTPLRFLSITMQKYYFINTTTLTRVLVQAEGTKIILHLASLGVISC